MRLLQKDDAIAKDIRGGRWWCGNRGARYHLVLIRTADDRLAALSMGDGHVPRLLIIHKPGSLGEPIYIVVAP